MLTTFWLKAKLINPCESALQAEQIASQILGALVSGMSSVREAAAAKGLATIPHSDKELHTKLKHATSRVAKYVEQLNCPAAFVPLFQSLWPEVLKSLQCAGKDVQLVECCLKIVTCAPSPGPSRLTSLSKPLTPQPLSLTPSTPQTPGRRDVRSLGSTNTNNTLHGGVRQFCVLQRCMRGCALRV